MVYAQIDENNICFAVSSLNGEVIADNLIPLEVFDTSVLGKKWTGNGWEDVPQPEPAPEEKQPTNAELMTEIKKSQQDVIDEYTLQLIEQGIL